MKKFSLLFLLLTMVSCSQKEKTSELNYPLTNAQSKPISDVTFEEPEKLLAYKDNKESYIIKTKTFSKNENKFSLHYNYPSLDESQNPLWQSFNQFIEDSYINSENAVQKILKNDALSCDTRYSDAKRVKRSIDYKVYTKENNFLSVLLYKTNYYEDQYHNSFMFKGLNYDLERGVFITYEDLFKEGSEQILLFKFNQELEARKTAQDSFNDCWKFTEDTFSHVKNNFVIDGKTIKFYFDDCAVCPTYSGNYYLEIPIEELNLVMKTKDQKNMIKDIN